MARRRKKKSALSSLGFTWSWKRLLGVTRAKQSFARSTGIPTTKQSLHRKLGRSVLRLFGL